MSEWKRTADELPPDEWFFLTGWNFFQSLEVVEDRDGVPRLAVMLQGTTSKPYFKRTVSWWRIPEYPEGVLEQRHAALMEQERKALEYDRTTKFKMLTYEMEKRAKQQEKFDAWVAAGKPTPEP